MPHIDEGMLHAWLDRDRSGLAEAEAGDVASHLADCAECRARLAAAERLRDQAGVILAAGGPTSIATPPFEQLTARSRGGRRRSVRQTAVIAGWAASIVVAVGLGWLSRDLLRPEQLALETSRLESGAAVSSAPSMAAPPQAPTTRGSGASVATLDQGPESDAVLAPDPSPAVVASPSVVAESATPAASRSAADSRDQAIALEAVSARTRSTAGSAAPAAPPPPAATAAPERALAGGFSAQAAGSPGQAATRAAAEARLGRPLLTLPDLAIDRFELLADADRPAVRVVQILGDGTQLILTQSLSEAPPSFFGALPEGVFRATERRADLWLALEGPLPPEALQALLAQAR